MKIISSFGQRIKEYRESNKLTLAEIENMTRIPAQTINRYELGRRIPKIDTAIQVAERLQLNPLWLFGYDTDQLHNLNQTAIDKNTLNLIERYAQLDEIDKIRVSERIDVMLEDEKYTSTKKALRNA